MATSSTAELGAAKPPHSGGKLHSAAKLLGVALLIPLAVAGILSLFAWPSANLEPRDLPLGLSGPSQATDALATKLEQASDGGFEIHQYADEADARSAIEDREIYGAVVVAPDGITLLTASAASPLVAQLLTQAVTAPDGLQAGGTQPGTQPGADTPAPPKVVDVVPTTADDPRGVVLGAATLPLVLAGLATGIVLSAVSRPGWAQAIALVATSALAALAVVWVAQEWLGALGGDWWLNAGVIGLTVLAIASTVAGLAGAIGPAGIGLGAIVMMLVGNPFSGMTSAPEMLPTWVGITGQLLPPGAGGNLLRSTAFFDAAAATQPVAVLAGWVLFGIVCGLVGVRRHRAARPTTATH